MGFLLNSRVYETLTNISFNEDLTHAVDLEVIKQRTNPPSETTTSRENFRTNLLARDACCVWTGSSNGIGMHIIPYKRGSEVISYCSCAGMCSHDSRFPWPLQWIQLIVANRPQYDEDLEDLNDINDIRNGIFSLVQIHNDFDPRRLVILKVRHAIHFYWSNLTSSLILRPLTTFLLPLTSPRVTCETRCPQTSFTRLTSVILYSG